nr:MAG TPA: hypothetical protein [Caudoviricetes sp.]
MLIHYNMSHTIMSRNHGQRYVAVNQNICGIIKISQLGW